MNADTAALLLLFVVALWPAIVALPTVLYRAFKAWRGSRRHALQEWRRQRGPRA